MSHAPSAAALPTADNKLKAYAYANAMIAAQNTNNLDKVISYGDKVLAISPDDRTLIMFPICYLIGFGSQILPFHNSGAVCILMPRFEPRLALVEGARAA